MFVFEYFPSLVQSRIDCSGICVATTWISAVAISISLVKRVCLEVPLGHLSAP